MICWTVKRRIGDYVDGRLRQRERSKLEAHLRRCDECRLRVHRLRSMRSSLVGLPDPVAPNNLRSRLLVMASRERQLLLESDGSRWVRFWNAWKFRLSELMQPFTIPATGGVASSMLLFSALAFTIGSTTQQAAYEVPVIYNAEQMNANLVPVQLQSAVEVSFSLDGRGHINAYSVSDGSASFVGDAGRLNHNNITMPEFPSVLVLPQPTIGDIRILLKPLVYKQ